MPEHPSSVAWLDKHALHDDSFAEAYDALNGAERAVLKKCIARLYQVWGETPPKESRTRAFIQGFGLEESSAPVPYVLLVCELSYPSPAAFLAALMPALLAGVEPVLPCFVPARDGGGMRHVPAALLAALELAGVERAFLAADDAVQDFFTSLSGRNAAGRLVLLGGAACGESLALEAHRKGLPCRSLTGLPRYFSVRLDEAAEQCFRPRSSGAAGGNAIPPDDAGDEDGLFLSLDAGHEDIWVWPDLGPDWFRTKRMRFFSLGSGAV